MVSLIPRAESATGACFGQCLNQGRGSKDKECRDCGAARRWRQYGLADCMQTTEGSCAHTKAVGEVEVRHLISALPKQSGIKSPHLTRRSFVRARKMAFQSLCHITAALKPRSLLIATDFSEASEKALRHSLALARLHGSRFCLAHVVSSLGLTMAGPSAIAACEEAVLREAAQLEMSLVRTGALAGIQHKFLVRRGELWPELREIIREENSDLLVVGTYGRHGMAKLFSLSR